MKFTRLGSTIALGIFLSLNVLAQTLSPKISFETLKYDFGTIKEADGKVSTVFKFQNLGQQPLMLKNVSSSCGCTTPSYPREPILPGKGGEIKAVFDPANRPGRFIKHITVYTNASDQPITLEISGNVEKRPPTISDTYPYSFDGIRLNKSHISFLKMDKGEVKDNIVKVINTTDKPVKLEFINTPEQISIRCEPQILQKDQEGQIYIKYDASKVDDWGFVLSSIFIKQNGKLNYNHKLSVSVTIEEDFSKLSAQEKAQAANINFESTTFNFGSIKSGESVDHSFKFTNTGNENLLIRKVKASCGCTAIEPSKSVIAPGETSEIKMVFHSKGKQGRQYKTITVITNSPSNQAAVLKIIGTVE